MQFKFKVVAPSRCATGWVEHEGVSWGDAANSWHIGQRGEKLGVGIPSPKGSNKSDVYFLVVENEAGEQLISRIFSTGLRRRGGVERSTQQERWQSAAKELGVKVESLQANDWEHEETDWQDSLGRKVKFTEPTE